MTQHKYYKENFNQKKLVTPMKSQAKDNITPEESQRRET